MQAVDDYERVRTLNYDHHRRMGENHAAFDPAQAERIVWLDNESMRSLLAPVPFCGNALELGSASGGQWPVLREWAEHLSGIDLYEPAVTQAQAEGKPIVLGLVEEMPFADASFDLVVSRHVMEHVGSVVTALREIKRVLRPGGYVAAVMPHYQPDPEPAHLNQLCHTEWRAWYEEMGFFPIECEVRSFNCEETHLVARTALRE